MNEPTMEKCPDCLKYPSRWREQPKYGSRELYWIGCRKCGHLCGALSENIVPHQWSSLVARLRYNKENKIHLEFTR